MVPRVRTRRQGSRRARAEHLEQCAEFLLLRNRGLGPLAVTVLPISLAMRAGVGGNGCDVRNLRACPENRRLGRARFFSKLARGDQFGTTQVWASGTLSFAGCP